MWIDPNTLIVYRSHSEIRNAWPNTSFPIELPEALIEEFLGLLPIIQTAIPNYNEFTEIAEEIAPVLIETQWTQQWQIRTLTAEEVYDRIPKSVTPLQGMLAIDYAGLTAQFLSWKAGLDPVLDFKTIVFLEKAQSWEYDNYILDDALIALEIVEQKAALFTLAATL